jgi:hypothetical protein
MAAYYILTQTITDLERYRDEYIPQALQGNPEPGVVVLRFPSEEAVRSWVNDPDYQPAKQLRLDVTSNGNAVLAPEFQMPGS